MNCRQQQHWQVGHSDTSAQPGGVSRAFMVAALCDLRQTVACDGMHAVHAYRVALLAFGVMHRHKPSPSHGRLCCCTGHTSCARAGRPSRRICMGRDSCRVEYSCFGLCVASMLYESLAARPCQLHGGISCCCQCGHMLLCGPLVYHTCMGSPEIMVLSGSHCLCMSIVPPTTQSEPCYYCTATAVDAVGVVSSLR
jgi:hypothetical protein